MALFNYSIASIIFLGLWLIFTPLFFFRRKLEPIRSRGWSYVMISNMITVIHFCFLCAVLDAYNHYQYIDCNVLVWEASFFLPIWTAPYLVRAFILYFKYKINQEKDKNDKSGRKGSDASATWFHNRRHWMTRKYMVGFMVVTVLSSWIITIIFQLALPKPSSEFNTLVECMNLQRIPIILQGVYSTAMVAFAAFKIMKIRDAYSIKTELFLVTMIAPPLFVTWQVLEWINLLPDTKYILILTAVGVVYLVVTIYPVYLTFVGRRLVRQISSINPNNVEEGLTAQDIFELCLTNDTLFAAFRQHCVESFCTENALFYRDCLIYLDMDEKSRKSEIINMRTLYLKESARLQINILGKTRKDTLEKIEQGDTSDNLFHDAMREVSQQMYQDTFPKFKVSNRFKVAWKKSKVEKNASIRSQDSGKHKAAMKKSASGAVSHKEAEEGLGMENLAHDKDENSGENLV